MAWDCFSNIQNAENVATIQCLEPLFIYVVQAIISISGVALFIMLLISGFNFLFSGGDQKKLELARGTMTNAIVGLVVIVIAYLLLKAISIIVGVPDLTKFVIPTE